MDSEAFREARIAPMPPGVAAALSALVKRAFPADQEIRALPAN